LTKVSYPLQGLQVVNSSLSPSLKGYKKELTLKTLGMVVNLPI